MTTTTQGLARPEHAIAHTLDLTESCYRRRRTPRLLWAAALVTVALVTGACGNDDDTASPATTAATADDNTVVEVVAVDYAFNDLPARVSAGTALRMRNESSAELHELIAYRLPGDEQRSAEELLALPEQELGALFAGEPDFGLFAAPGEFSFPVIGDGTFTAPGRYLILCAIPIGADPDQAMAALEEAAQSQSGPPQITGGAPHFSTGMYAELTVE